MPENPGTRLQLTVGATLAAARGLHAANAEAASAAGGPTLEAAASQPPPEPQPQPAKSTGRKGTKTG